MKTEKILLAGATGYLGGYILAELLKNGVNKNLLDEALCEGVQKFVYVSV